MTSSLHQQVRRTIRRHGLCPPGTRLIVGLSGGSDSVALTLLLLELAEYGQFVVEALAHLNHSLRPSAGADEAFCREFAARLGLRIVVESADVQAYARAHDLSVEDAARRVRYEFLKHAASGTAATRIAVGHTQDDQAETVLLKLMRGAGLTGLAGIHPRRGMVVRPLLDVTRADLRKYLRAGGERWVEDETNEDLGNPRNRIRHLVLPELDRAAGGPTRAALARAAALLREDGQWLDALGDERYAALAVETEVGVEFSSASLRGTPLPVARRVLLRGMRRVGGGEIGLDHVEAALALLSNARRGVDVPGARVELRGEKLVLLQQRRPLK